MNNLMAKAMSERYAEYLYSNTVEEKIAKNIYYWIMSTMESVFWGFRRIASFDFDLYANEKKIYFCFYDATGKKQKFVYYSTHNCEDGKLAVALQNFVDLFNNIDYPLSDRISSPVFYAYGLSEVKEGKYKGHYHIHVYVDMLPDEQN